MKSKILNLHNYPAKSLLEYLIGRFRAAESNRVHPCTFLLISGCIINDRWFIVSLDDH